MSRVLLTVPLVLTLAACSLAPDYARPEAPVPVSWPAGDAYLAQSEAALPAVSYRDVFRDPRLQALIGQAMANNRDVRIAAANLAAARAQVGVVRSAQFPQVGVGASADLQTREGVDSESYRIQGGIASFELDLFGRLANATEAQRANRS